MSQTTSGMTAWYTSRNGEASGPFATDMILSMIRDGQLQPLDLIFREGETEWRPVATYRELKSSNTEGSNSESKDRSHKNSSTAESIAPMHPSFDPNTTHAKDEKALQWIVLRPHTNTYLQEGPFETQTIIDGLQRGRFQFAQYAWHAGMSQWMRIGDLREFDRRSRSRDSQPHVPPPLPDPIAAVLLEDDNDIEAEEFHVSMRGTSKFDLTPNPLESMRALNVSQGRLAIGGAAAESPEARPYTQNLAPVPWEQDLRESDAQSVELIDDEHSGFYGQSQFDNTPHQMTPTPSVGGNTGGFAEAGAGPSTLDRTPLPFVPAAPMAVTQDAWDKWGKYVAGTGMLGLFLIFATHLAISSPEPARRIQADAPVEFEPSEDIAVDSSATAEPEAVVTALDPAVAVSPLDAPPEFAVPILPAPAPVPSDFAVVGLKLDRPDGQIVIQGTFPPEIPIQVMIKGRLGQILSNMNVRRTVAVQRKGGEIPSLLLKDLKLPMGAYTIEVEAGGAKASNEIFIGQRDKKFIDRLEAHLREISFETQSQKKALFYAAQELDILARDLGQNYGQLRAKSEQWSVFYGKWTKRVDSVSRALGEIGKKIPDEQAYPEETTSLFQALATLNDLASQYSEAIGQKRDIASDTLTDLIAELARQKRSIGETTSRPTADTPDGML